MHFQVIIVLSVCTYNANEVIRMIDYKTIGAKIRKRRINCKLSQEKLAEMCDVGTTHISHIETGNCIPSLKVFIGIINALNCSADELLCDELEKAEHTYSSEISNLLEDCSSHELMIITDTIQALKSSLRK
jgi:transcriptional regulator with XRE-family HTH domain